MIRIKFRENLSSSSFQITIFFKIDIIFNTNKNIVRHLSLQKLKCNYGGHFFPEKKFPDFSWPIKHFSLMYCYVLKSIGFDRWAK